MDKPLITFVQTEKSEASYTIVYKEIVRKGIHSSIAIVPFFASVNMQYTLIALTAVLIVYIASEFFRMAGMNRTLIANLTNLASRENEQGKVVLGPITLLLGTILTLLLFPKNIACIAIYALAFGDGVASIAGKKFASFVLPFTKGKTFAGSFACFMLIYVCTFRVTFSMAASFIIALIGTFIESLPLKDFDNVALPIGVGAVAYVLVPLLA